MITGLLIVQHLLSKEEQIKIAKAILTAQDYYEESFYTEVTCGGCIIPRYRITNSDAAVMACKDLELDIFWANCIGHWNFMMWNDVQGWAEIVIKEYNTIKQINTV